MERRAQKYLTEFRENVEVKKCWLMYGDHVV